MLRQGQLRNPIKSFFMTRSPLVARRLREARTVSDLFRVLAAGGTFSALRDHVDFGRIEPCTTGEELEGVLALRSSGPPLPGLDDHVAREVAGTEVVILSESTTDMDYLVDRERVRPSAVVADYIARMTPPLYMCGLVHPLLPSRPIAFCSLAIWSLPLGPSFLKDLAAPNPGHDRASGKTEKKAVFYSINACYEHLGVGASFLKRVATLMTREHGVSEVVTFSPIPELCQHQQGRKLDRQAVEDHLLDKCKVYRFHTTNGAFLDGIIEGGDTSEQGVRQSNGWQASYRYPISLFRCK